ncbi:MAG: hypothetical protein RIQ93_1382, partial [Verrucomicrobiota bacterium]
MPRLLVVRLSLIVSLFAAGCSKNQKTSDAGSSTGDSATMVSKGGGSGAKAATGKSGGGGGKSGGGRGSGGQTQAVEA